jgi:MinD-like ATPase involved in chromosome partitioning or flagellar assembly
MAIASGKGGVGKSFFALNLAWSLCELGQRVLIVELDVDAGSLALASGLGEMAAARPATTASDLAHRVVTLPGSNQLHLLRGVDIAPQWLCAPSIFEPILAAIAAPLRIQWIIFDLAPGVGRSTVLWLSRAQLPIVIGTPELVCTQAMLRLHKQTKYQHAYEKLLIDEPRLRNGSPSLKDAKQLLYTLHDHNTAEAMWTHALQSWRAQWIFNRTLSDDTAQLQRIHGYLQKQIGEMSLTSLPEDTAQTKCARYGRVLTRYEPQSALASVIRQFASTLLQQTATPLTMESSASVAAA